MADAEHTFGWASGTADALVQPHFEYMRKNRWILEFARLPGSLGGGDSGMVLRINCSKARRPKISFEETKVERINGRVYLAGKPTFDTMAVSFYDNLNPSFSVPGLQVSSSVSDIMENWREQIYQPNMGDAFGSVANYKGFARLHMLEPVSPLDGSGDNAEGMNLTAADVGSSITQTWIYQGIFPLDIDYGELDYGSSDVQEVNVTFRFDRAYRVPKANAISA